MSWTVDIPKEVLPDLPPLPAGLQERFEDVISREAKQQPSWDRNQAETVRKILESVPPTVVAPEVTALKKQLADVALGKAFLMQGGDCAETFESNTEPHIRANIKTLLQMAVVLTYGASTPVVKMARIAGQYAKPRSADMEVRDGVELPSYRGDIVNGPAFTAEARVPDPRRMVKAHARSAMTMNFVRALVDGGFADLHHPEYWDLGWVTHSPLAHEYQRMVANIGEAVRFMETLSGNEVHNLNRVDFFTSHEALLLPYEDGGPTGFDALRKQFGQSSN